MITLAIIGVVAALTIPTVVAKYQKKQYYTQFMKTYNVLSEAITMAVNENGPIDTWGYTYGHEDITKEIIEKNISPYLKVAKKITESDTEYNYPVTLLSGEKDYEDYGEVKNYSAGWNYISEDEPTYELSDGSIVSFRLYEGGFMHIECSFDTNGLKGPNTLGRDIFNGLYYMKVDGKYIIIPPGMSKSKSGGGYTLRSREEVEQLLNGNDDRYGDCKPNGEESQGSLCPAKLLLDGKMDY